MSAITPHNVREELAKHLLADVVPVIVDLDRSHGNRLVDIRDGREWLDCYSYVASNAVGYNHPKVRDPQFEQRLLRAARSKPANSDFYTQEMGEFVHTFARLAAPPGFPHFFFIEGGAMAVENALKAAFDWKVRKNKAKGISGELGTRVLHFRQAFHGRSGYTLSLTNTADQRKTKFFPKFDWPRVSNPKLRFPLTEEVIRATAEAEQQSHDEMVAAFDQYPDDIAAIIIEPIQGEGGDNHFRPEFHQMLRAMADRYEALLIYDEVQSGLGLTGRMWAHQHYGMAPDIVAFGKKTQVCGIMVSERIAEVENHVFQEPSRLNSTWGGALVDMVRCQRYLELIDEDSLVANAASVGAYLLQGLERLSEKFPGLILNCRGRGLMCAFDLSSTELRDELFRECFKRNVLILKAGLLTIRLRPSLTFSQADVDELLNVVADAAAALSAV